ncbi:hypothetical protein, partial [Streptacidiphilus neutrinimicus]|uniref:hypothetical protein n=1 Tax=Streptacidiphilus neutrinimicus TaxID=105420 RepID=UPI0005A93876
TRPRGPGLAAVPQRAGAVRTAVRAPAATLPKRVPGESGQLAQITDPAPGAETAAAGPQSAGSAADELRRRLGGFQNGLRAAAAPREEDDKA